MKSVSNYLKTRHPFVWRKVSDGVRWWIALSKKRVPLPAPEMRRFSQNGEDGVLAKIFEKIGPAFGGRVVEIGIEDGRECNARNLIVNWGWSGILVDCMPYYTVLAKDLYRQYPVEIRTLMVEPANMNDLVPGDVDLVSIDVDGMDYWLWKGLRAAPRVVVIEYNAKLGYEQESVTEYQRGFNRSKLPDNGRLAGASYQALTKLGEEKGYGLVYRESSETNLFFLRKDLMQKLPEHLGS